MRGDRRGHVLRHSRIGRVNLENYLTYMNERISDHISFGRISWARRTMEAGGAGSGEQVRRRRQMRMETRVRRREALEGLLVAVDAGGEGGEVAGGESGGGVGEDGDDRGGAVVEGGDDLQGSQWLRTAPAGARGSRARERRGR